MKTKKLCVIALGIALYVALALCLQVPVFENYYLCLGYVAMAVWCYSFGPFAGAAVGTLGVVLYCLLISGLRGMPGWAAGNLLIGVALGLVFRHTHSMKRTAAWWILNALVIIAATAIGILVLKSITEQILYVQPFLLRAAKNIYAFVADAVMLLVSLPLCVQMDKYLHSHLPDLVT